MNKTESKDIKKKGRPSKIEKAIREGSQKRISEFFKDEKKISLEEIIIGERKRSQYNEGKINELAESIQEIGLINPITIDQNKNLVAGYHRILAFRKLGREKIPYRMTTLTDPLKLELQEIDENLIREEVNYIEWCELLVRRQEIYEEMYPETKHGEHLKRYPRDSKGHLAYNDKLSSLEKTHFTDGDKLSSVEKPFSEDIGNKLSKSQRTIQRALQIAKNILPELKQAIIGTKLSERKMDLLKISEKKNNEQKELLDTILKMKEDNIKIENLKYIKKQIIFYKKYSESKEIKKANEALIFKIDSTEDFYRRKILKYERKIERYLFSKEDNLGPFDLWKRLTSTNDQRWLKGRCYTYRYCDLKNLNYDVITGESLTDANFTLHHQPYRFKRMLTRYAFPINKNTHPKPTTPELEGKEWDLFKGGFIKKGEKIKDV